MDQWPAPRSAKRTTVAHIEAVKAALTDGRLGVESFAVLSGVSPEVVNHWLRNDHIQESYEPRLWAAAVTSNVPGWPTYRSALELRLNESSSEGEAGPAELSPDNSVRLRRVAAQALAWEALLDAADVLMGFGAVDLRKWQLIFDASSPIAGAWQLALQPHDVVIALLYHDTPGLTVDHVAKTLKLTPSDAASSLERLKLTGILSYDGGNGLSVSPHALMEFLCHGIRYVFPATLGDNGRGLGTAYLRDVEEGENCSEAAVWPAQDEGDYGRALQPLLTSFVDVVGRYPEVYNLLAAVDAIRLGRAEDALAARAYVSRALIYKHREAPTTSTGAATRAQSDDEREIQVWRETLRRLRVESKRCCDAIGATAFAELVSKPHAALAGPTGIPLSLHAAVLTTDLERVVRYLYWTAEVAYMDAPHDTSLPDDEESNARFSQRYARVFAAALECLGDEKKAEHWLATPNRALAGAIPFRLLHSDVGERQVLSILVRLDHGIPS